MALKALGDQRNQEYQKWAYDTSAELNPFHPGHNAAVQLAENYAKINSYYFSFTIPGRGQLIQDIRRLGQDLAYQDKEKRANQARKEA